MVKLLLEDNQKLRETIVDLAKRFPQNSNIQDEIESFTVALLGPTTEPTMTKPKLLKEKRGMEIMATAMGKNLSTPIIRASNLKGQVPQESSLC